MTYASDYISLYKLNIKKPFIFSILTLDEPTYLIQMTLRTFEIEC